MLTRYLLVTLLLSQACLAGAPGLGRGVSMYRGSYFTTDISPGATNTLYTSSSFYFSSSTLEFVGHKFIAPSYVRLLSFDYTGPNNSYFSIDTHSMSVIDSAGMVIPSGDLALRDSTSTSIILDHTGLGYPSQVKIDGYSLLGNGDQLISFDQDFTAVSGSVLASIGFIYKNDIIGITTSGTAYFFLDSVNTGSGKINLNLPRRLNVDSIDIDEESGEVMIGFDTAGKIGGIPFYKSDMLGYNRYGSGQWRLIWDGPAKSPRMYAVNMTGFSLLLTEQDDVLFSDSLEKRWRY